MAFTLPNLPYPADALEPHIDAQTMTIHHDKHHAAYLAKMLAALEGKQELEFSIEQILARAGALGAAVRNNAGGFYNHNLFWRCMAPDGGGDPSGGMAVQIKSVFGSIDALREELSASATTRFGSGFAWLIVKDHGLKVASTPNQDNPLMNDVVSPDVAGTPILGIDVWEHAYYLKYKNRRPDYIKAFWNVVDWKATAERFAAAMG